MAALTKITRPSLLLDEVKCKRNIHKMVSQTRNLGLRFRPHFKTHQSAFVGEWLKDEGVDACTVSSMKMAEYFADNGWNDILIAFPVNVLEVEAINRLAGNINLQLLVYDPLSIDLLEPEFSANAGVKIELDLGNKRSGLEPGDLDEIEILLERIIRSKQFKFTGFYSHPGHTYTARSAGEVREMYKGLLYKLEELKKYFGDQEGFQITIGDTPGASIIEDFGPVNEISPGNFVFYDVMQVNIGSCAYDDIALVMACPVTGKNPARNELLIHGGAVHFSKEMLVDPDGTKHFGKLAEPKGDSWSGVIPGAYLKSISQEHGLIHCSDELIAKTTIGDILYIYPAHSCLTADLMKSYRLTHGILLEGPGNFLT